MKDFALSLKSTFHASANEGRKIEWHCMAGLLAEEKVN